jgi:hypothetical protein
VLAFNEDPLEGKVDKDKNRAGDFFEQDKRSGSRFFQGWAAVD